MFVRRLRRFGPAGTLITLVVIAAAAGGVGFAAASFTDSHGSIQACVSRDGTLRVVPSATDCHRGEAPLAWSIQGPAGPTGPQGHDGPAGPAATSVRHVTVTLRADEFQFIVARCGAGEVATGGGFGSNSQLAAFSENSPVPVDGTPDAWVVGARNTSSVVSGVQAVAYVVCAPGATH